MAVDAHLVRMGFSPSAQFVYMGSGRRSKPLPYGWALVHPLNVIHSSFGSGSRPHLTTHSGLVHPLWFVGRNETAPDLLSTIYLSRAHSDIQVIGGVRNGSGFRPSNSVWYIWAGAGGASTVRFAPSIMTSPVRMGSGTREAGY